MALDRPGAAARHPPDQPRRRAVHRAGRAPTVGGRARVPRRARRAGTRRERGYSAIQATKPQTLGYGLNDSPAGLAAWILEKWRAWADSGGDLDARFARDFLLTMLTLYWVTQTIASSMRDYCDNRRGGPALGPGDVRDGADRRRRASRTSSCPRAGRRASGSSACTTSAAGRRCRAAGTSPPPRSRSCSPRTSPRSSPRWPDSVGPPATSPRPS